MKELNFNQPWPKHEHIYYAAQQQSYLNPNPGSQNMQKL